MRNRPVLLLACMLFAGTGCRITRQPWVILLAAAVILYTGPWKESGGRRFLFAAGLPLFFLLGFFYTDHEIAFRESYLQKVKDGQEIVLAGKIDRIEHKTKCVYYYLSDCTINLSGTHMPCNDVIAYVSADEYSIGQILVLEGKIALFSKASNDGGFDSCTFYQSQKIDFGIWVDKIRKAEGKPDQYRIFLEELRERLQKILEKNVYDKGVLSAMLLGERAGLDAGVKSLYQQSGIAHILAISGLHISILGMGWYQLLRKKFKCGYISASALTVLFMISYALMSGNGVSARRAVIMLFFYLLADILGRGYDMLSALAAAVVILLLENPFVIYYSGFQLSVMAILGIGTGGEVFCRWNDLKEKTQKTKMDEIWKKQKNGFCVSLSIQLFTLPLIACNYYEIPVYAMLLNFLILALAGILMKCALAGVLAGLLNSGISRVILMPCSWILQSYEKMCHFSLQLPGSRYICGKPKESRLFLYYLFLAVFFYLLWCRTRYKRKHEIRKRCYVLVFVGVGFLLTILLFPRKKIQEIDFLDVGQGDGVYICTSDGVSMFVDGGSSDNQKIGIYGILPFLKSHAVRRVSFWFVSHTDADHISGLKEVLEQGYPVDYLVFAKAVRSNPKTRELSVLAEKNHTRLLFMEKGDVIRTGKATVSCLYPEENESSDDVNDACLVLRYQEKNISVFLGGDISEKVEKKLLLHGQIRKTQIYKADHHGSRYSNDSDFLQALSPEIAVISCGKNNRYGHPTKEAVKNIQDSGAEVYMTMKEGQVKFVVKKEELPGNRLRLLRDFVFISIMIKKMCL